MTSEAVDTGGRGEISAREAIGVVERLLDRLVEMKKRPVKWLALTRLDEEALAKLIDVAMDADEGLAMARAALAGGNKR